MTAPFRLGLNHQQIAEEIHSDRAKVFETLKPVHQDLPRFWIGHSLGCKYIVLLESTGEGDFKSFLLEDQPSILLAPDVSNTYDAVKIGVIAKYLDDIGQGVNPDRAKLAAMLAASNRFNLTAIVSFELDDVAGNQAQSAEAPDFSDVALISEIIESKPSRTLLKAELADCKHLEPVGLQVVKSDGSLALVDLDLADGFLEPVRDRLLEPKVVELLSQLQLKLAGLKK